MRKQFHFQTISLFLSGTAESREFKQKVFQRFKDANLKFNPLHVSLSDIMCHSWLTLSPKIKIEPIQLKHQLWATSQYPIQLVRLNKIGQSVLTIHRTPFCTICSASSAANWEIEKTPLQPRRPARLWTSDSLSRFVINLIIFFNERTLQSIDWPQLVCHRRRPCSLKNGLERVFCYTSKSVSKAQFCYSTKKPVLSVTFKYTRHLKYYLLRRQLKNE